MLASGLLLAGTAACSANESPATGPQPSGTVGTVPSPSVRPVTRPARRATPTAAPKPLSATQVVAALKATGYRCGTESTYAICAAGPVQVWVLTGDHRRVQVVSVHSAGAVAAARTAVGGRLARVLASAHVAEGARIADWYAAQRSRSSAATTIAGWRIKLSVESASDQPGVHLTLTDKDCTTECQSE